jgi:hypothetical protein
MLPACARAQAIAGEHVLCGGVRDGVSIRCLRTLQLKAVLHLGGVARVSVAPTQSCAHAVAAASPREMGSPAH